MFRIKEAEHKSSFPPGVFAKWSLPASTQWWMSRELVPVRLIAASSEIIGTLAVHSEHHTRARLPDVLRMYVSRASMVVRVRRLMLIILANSHEFTVVDPTRPQGNRALKACPESACREAAEPKLSCCQLPGEQPLLIIGQPWLSETGFT
jgi:hypothetical protein